MPAIVIDGGTNEDSSRLNSTVNGVINNIFSTNLDFGLSLPPPPSVRNLVASVNVLYQQNDDGEVGGVGVGIGGGGSSYSSYSDSLDNFVDLDDDLFGSPMPFDASENGLWNGRFVPPPPRPPFLMDDPIISEGLSSTCDLCSWAMPTKSTFIFEGTIEKASELGWPLTLIIVSVLSAILGAILMVVIVRCRRKKSASSRNENSNVQWWSRKHQQHNNSVGSNNSNQQQLYRFHRTMSSHAASGLSNNNNNNHNSNSSISNNNIDSTNMNGNNNNNSGTNNHHPHHLHTNNFRRGNIYTAHPQSGNSTATVDNIRYQQSSAGIPSTSTQHHHHHHHPFSFDDHQSQQQQQQHPQQSHHHSHSVVEPTCRNWPNVTTLVVVSSS
ncbi:hypothetical protein ACFFRR_010947 [Megaselia abdita]